MAFPSSPINGQVATVNGIAYTYSSGTRSWARVQGSVANLVINTTLVTGGNVTANALTVNNSATVGTTLSVLGNLTIGTTGTNGNITGVNNLFANSLTSNANSTVQALTINNSATIGTTLRASGGLQATPIGNASASTANISSLTVTGISYFNSNVITNNIVPFGNANANIGSTALQYNTIFAKATSAQYADLAEIYTSDSNYKPGTVVIFGGTKEITVTMESHDKRVAGVISTEPAYLMNSGADGLPVAFTGRVPCFVQGPINKGDLLVTSQVPGIAAALDDTMYKPGCVFGKSLEIISSDQITLIEVAVGRY